MEIKGSTALVTGANRGIGRALVDALLEAGARKVYAGSRSLDKLDISDERVIPLELDVTDRESIRAAAARAGDVNLLVNNAGILHFGDILQAPREELERNLAVNLYGKLDMAREFVPVIKNNGDGAVVNILTLVALVSMPGLAMYNASKAAAWSMSLSLRATLADAGIAVHNVFPGAIDTDMLSGVEMDKTSPEYVAQAVVSGIAEGREDIFPDPMSTSVYEAWRNDHKAVEKQFAAM